MGDEPPYRAPVFVLTHQERPPLEMQGGTTFHFTDAGIASAVAQAQEAAGGRDVLIAGGAAAVVSQALRAGLVDDFQLHVVPLLLGGGARLFDGVDPQAFAADRCRPHRRRHAPALPMRLILNVIWLVLAGFWMSSATRSRP